MEAAVAHPDIQETDWLSNLANEHITQWLETCDRFRKWERAKILHEEPPPELLAAHKRALRFLIANTRMMLSSISDPEVYDTRLFKQLEVTLWLLNESWEMVYNPMPEEEAKELLAKVFPE
jgi:hypothetical protein